MIPKGEQKIMPKHNEPQEEAFDFQSFIKGIIAIFITILIVVIIVMLFAKSLFSPTASSKQNVKTGHLTETYYIDKDNLPLPEVDDAVTTKAKKKTTTKKEDPTPSVDLPEGLDTSIAGQYIVNDAVYLHPEPNSSSANLATLQAGKTVTVFGNSNYGWYYLEYEGQYGYAWSSYLTAAQ